VGWGDDRFIAFYWGAEISMVGRFIGYGEAPGLLQTTREDGATAGHLCSVRCRILVAISMLSTGQVAMWSIILVGFFNSIMFPSIFTLGVAELGPLTGDGSGIMIMAIVGGAIIPLAQGAIADRIGIHHAFFLPVICYLYILFFAAERFEAK
jgi:MFS transporter, FHS family, L-fucose permease